MADGRVGGDVHCAAKGGCAGGEVGKIGIGQLIVYRCEECGAITLPEDEVKHREWHTEERLMRTDHDPYE